MDIDVVNTPSATPEVVKKALERFPHGGEGDLLPRYFSFVKQTGFHGFVSRIELIAQQSGQIENVHLSHARNAHGAEKRSHFNLRASFFRGLASSPLGYRFIHFHESSWQCPFAQPGFNVSLA